MKSNKKLLLLLLALTSSVMLLEANTMPPKKSTPAKKPTPARKPTPAKKPTPKGKVPPVVPTPTPPVVVTPPTPQVTPPTPSPQPTSSAIPAYMVPGLMNFYVLFNQQPVNTQATTNSSSYAPYAMVPPTFSPASSSWQMTSYFNNQFPAPMLWAVNTNNLYSMQAATTTVTPFLALNSMYGGFNSSAASLYTNPGAPATGTQAECLYQYTFDAVSAAVFSGLTEHVAVVPNGNGLFVLASSCGVPGALQGVTVLNAAPSNTTTPNQTISVTGTELGTGNTKTTSVPLVYNPGAASLIKSKVFYAVPDVQLSTLPLGGRYLYKLDCSANGVDVNSLVCQILGTLTTTTYIDIFNGTLFQEQPDTVSGNPIIYPMNIMLPPGTIQSISQTLGSPSNQTAPVPAQKDAPAGTQPTPPVVLPPGKLLLTAAATSASITTPAPATSSTTGVGGTSLVVPH